MSPWPTVNLSGSCTEAAVSCSLVINSTGLRHDITAKRRAFLNNHTIPTFYWVGLTDQTTGQWRWVDDTPYIMNKERWNPDQPDDWRAHGLGAEGEDCAQIAYSGKLNDNHCSVKMRFICRVQF